MASSVNGRIELPTTSIEAIQLLWLALLFGSGRLEDGPASSRVEEVALELTVLADQLELDEIALIVSRCILSSWLLTEQQAEGARWTIQLFAAAERQPTAGSLWDHIRPHVARWANELLCTRHSHAVSVTRSLSSWSREFGIALVHSFESTCCTWCGCSSRSGWAEAHCRVRTCGVARLSYESLV